MTVDGVYAAHAKKNDRLTSWWRGISLRAKVTGVTVAVLTVGLLAAGFGTAVFLRNAQIAERDQSISQTVTLDQASSLLNVEVVEGVAQFEPADYPPLTSFSIAVYGPDGTLLATGGPAQSDGPVFPATFGLDRTLMQGTAPFELFSADGETVYHAAVDVLQIPGARENNVQLLALPLTPVTQTVASFVGIYSILAILTILASALLTRWLVTLAFGSLGQVEQTAMSIARGDFGQRMGDIAPGTEVGKLKTAINAMLDRVDHALGQRDATVLQMRRFIGDASHELRTPLVTVRGYAELYRMGAISGDEQTAQSMERIEKEAIRMGGLVEDLLALARLDERRDIVVAPVDLRPIARDAVLDARATAPERTVSFLDDAPAPRLLRPASAPPTSSSPTRRRPPTAAIGALLRRRPRPGEETGTPAPAERPPVLAAREPIVLGDENRIRQVVANLLGNARRYTPEGSPVELAVGVDEPAGMGWISVIDHGDGIPPQLRDKIFQRFWRADTSRTRETGGSGLGLSIVASVVEALHGSIVVSETPGGGATFRVAFPLAQARDAAEHLFIETQPLPRLHADS
ncbi:HAMP domain-containing protein [Microbacterium hominis]|uniref:sensor histidine kinase n=1 Tax=Microbacterium TaxID=33882 RepID=UPI00168ABFBA|nr:MULTISPECIES: HAMP domain-containing sensor histidine kinase [Microbacterium]QOC24893.1 HAMP domain-containing protein [Microbacterium hominis]QOC28943.1 HAMP domain-containing protein [Microbacterium hominis]QYF98853.1 HAMP domain-containing protein [Microbacterium sp. PAMC21962]